MALYIMYVKLVNFFKTHFQKKKLSILFIFSKPNNSKMFCIHKAIVFKFYRCCISVQKKYVLSIGAQNEHSVCASISCLSTIHLSIPLRL